MLQKLSYFANWLLPRLCVCCDFSSDNSELDLCDNCRDNLPWLDYRCYQCGLPILAASEAIICDRCQVSAPPFNRLCALFRYQQPIIKLIGALKFGRQLYPGALFGQLLTEAITQRWYLNKALPQVIMPVPLSIKRHRARGYNQAVELSLPLAKNLGISLDLTSCRRVKHTRPQTRLDKEQRANNLAGAFVVDNLLRYKHVALVDDVVTTGSTIRALSIALQVAGVEVIDVWCICRA